MVYSAVLEYLGSPVTVEEIASLGLSKTTLNRLCSLIEASRQRSLTPMEQAQLEGFREAAFYIRMGAQKSA